jgi:hypothetical protein
MRGSRSSSVVELTYDDLFLLWQNADPEIPILKNARTEYAKLPPP